SSELFDFAGGLEGLPGAGRGAGRGAAFSATEAAENAKTRNNAGVMKGMRRACIAAPPIRVVVIASSLTLWSIPQINDASAGWRLLQSYDDTEKSVGNWGLVDLP